jgi:Ca2+-binding RTX toxin-like protein
LKWGSGGTGTSATVTYSFPSKNAAWLGGYGDGEPSHGFQSFTSAQRAAARKAFSAWSAVADISFVEVADTPSSVGIIRLANSTVVGGSDAAAWGYFPHRAPEGGDVWFDPHHSPNLKLGRGQFGYMAMVHEIGHAIGLDHPFADKPGELAFPKSLDNQRYSIMSYTPYSGATIEAYGPMLYDILAIQHIYGANMTTRAGDTVYKFSAATEYLECIWDAGGHDTIDLSNQTRNQVIDLQAGKFSSIGIRNDGKTATGNVGIAFHVTIEDAIGGSGHDTIRGNSVTNLLKGGGGNDAINGGAGNDSVEGGAGNDMLSGDGGNDVLVGGTGKDRMQGGIGNDTYYVTLGDVVTESSGGGVDTVRSGSNFTLSSFVENLVLVGSAVTGRGNALGNTITGTAAANILDGLGGADLLKGGAGNDTYVVDNAGDVVDEGSNTDTGDTIRTTLISLGAASGVENYVFSGVGAWTFVGGDDADRATGGASHDLLDGAGGNDTLLGGLGNDTMAGGIGDDWLDGGLGKNVLKGGAGNDDSSDAVRAGFLIGRLIAGIESYIYTGASAWTFVGDSNANKLSGGAARDILSGADDNDVLLGNAGNDILAGDTGDDWLDGGAGLDALKGGAGNDTYVVDSLAEIAGEGSFTDAGDTVRSTVLIASPIAGIEHYAYLGTKTWLFTGTDDANSISGGTADDKLNGSEGNDTLLGNGGNDELTGGNGDDSLDGGAGNDVMTGGVGNDTYVVNAGGDVVSELGGDGDDLVYASVSFQLGSGIESLTLTGDAISGKGNADANTVIGTSADNVLDGDGGADTLKGGAGNDTYLVDDAGDVVDGGSECRRG